MIKFRDKPKVKAANEDMLAKDVVPAVEPASVAAKEATAIVEPLPKAERAKSEDVKQ